MEQNTVFIGALRRYLGGPNTGLPGVTVVPPEPLGVAGDELEPPPLAANTAPTAPPATRAAITNLVLDFPRADGATFT
jgi:hypothetical protein